MNKVRSGTPLHNVPSLCRSCRSATVIAGTRLDDETIICGNLPNNNARITFKVTECSSYDDRSRPSLNAMQSIAWELCTDKAGRKIGFLSPIERDIKQKDLRPTRWLDADDLRRNDQTH